MENKKVHTKFLPTQRYTYYEDLFLAILGGSKKEVKHGAYVSWSDEIHRKPIVKCSYRDGNLHGIYERFDEVSGALMEKKFYFKGSEMSEDTWIKLSKEEEVQRLTEVFSW